MINDNLKLYDMLIKSSSILVIISYSKEFDPNRKEECNNIEIFFDE
jgi:hypothetical protein